MNIRFADALDISALIPLYTSLGYPTDHKTLTRRLMPIFDHKDYFMIVAKLEGEIVGFCGYSRMFSFEHDGECVRILALVTQRDHQGKGIGTLMLDFVQDWAKGKGISQIALTSGLREERERAHNFYLNYGFNKKSYGFIYDIK